MGDKKVSTKIDNSQMRHFTKAVLNDLQAIEQMLAGDLFEKDVLRIGSEQEMFIVDSAMCAAPLALDIIEAAGDKRLTTELGLFNLEANGSTYEFEGKCLSAMEKELLEVVEIASQTAKKFDADVVLTGILPTLQMSDFVKENLTPQPRYEEMNRVLTELHGENRLIQIRGLDEIQLHVENVFVEFSNTSFQLHLQVGIGDFVRSYNWAQAVAAPVLACAVNSPLLIGHRLWHETRIALFQHATDARSPIFQERNNPPRVNFGDDWMSEQMIDYFQEDVVRYRFILTRQTQEDSLEKLERGEIPDLTAWQMHNGTIWRWNRPCYGVLNGKPSLRIEARFLPSGPTILDEMANSAFFLGLMIALPQEFGDVAKRISFDEVKNNFFNVARFGLQTQISWLDGKSLRAKRLILEDLLPLARKGLEIVKVDSQDIEKYLGIIEKRVAAEKTGAGWMLASLAEMDETAKLNVRLRTLTAQIKTNQEKNQPVHTWELAKIENSESDWIDNFRTVEHFMTKQLFTVRPEDVIDLAASLMTWKHIQHVPVEDDQGNLAGILSHRDLLEIVATDKTKQTGEIVVRDIMKTDLVTIAPETPTLEALNLMRDKNIGSLPIVKEGKLVGLITAHDFLTVSAKLLEERLKEIK